MTGFFLFRPYEEKAASKLTAPTKRARDLFQNYDLGRWTGQLSESTFRDGLSYLDLLDRIPADFFASTTSESWADIGSRDFAYAWALVHFLTHRKVLVSALQGNEITGNRFYRDFSTQKKRSDFHLKQIKKVFPQIQFSYVAGDTRKYPVHTDGVFWFFPFVTGSAHRAWGLAPAQFQPAELLGAVTAVKMVVFHFGDEERDLFQGLMEKQRPSHRRIFSEAVEGSLHPSEEKIWVTTWIGPRD